MKTKKETNQFYFDTHLHIPEERMEKVLCTSIERGIDAIFITDYELTNSYEHLSENKDSCENPVINPKKWDIKHIKYNILEISNNNGSVYAVKASEVSTKQGHVLVWNAKEKINSGIDIEETLRQAYNQKGEVVFPHLLVKLFLGCGQEVFDEMSKKFPKIGLEKNGQIPAIFNYNKKVVDVAREKKIACFGGSDIHGLYLNEYKKVGLLTHSSIDKKYINPKTIFESLEYIMMQYPDEIKIEGKSNSLFDLIMWNLDCFRKYPMKKTKFSLQGITNLIKK